MNRLDALVTALGDVNNITGLAALFVIGLAACWWMIDASPLPFVVRFRKHILAGFWTCVLVADLLNVGFIAFVLPRM